MSTELIGYVLAGISSIFFGLYVVPRKLSKLQPLQFSFWMAVGFSISSLAVYLCQPFIHFHETISPTLGWSVVAGIIWAAAFVSLVKSIDAIGLSRSNQWKNLQGPIAALLSLIFLSEYHLTHPVFVLLAGVMIAASAACFNIATSSKTAKVSKLGVHLAVLAGVGFGTVAVIQKHVTDNVGVYSQQVVWSFSILASVLVYMYIKHPKQLRELSATAQERRLGLAAGLLYCGASFFQLYSYQHLPASIAFTIIQLNALWTIAIGIFWFKEIPVKKFQKRLLLGLLFAGLGIITLTLARK